MRVSSGMFLVLLGTVVIGAIFMYFSFLSVRDSSNSVNFGDTSAPIVLVTGGAGFIGTHTIVELLESGRRVVCLDNYINSNPRSIERVRQIVGPSKANNLVSFRVDVTSLAEVDRVFQMFSLPQSKQSHISHVIHFCGLKAVGESVSHPEEYYRDNIDSVLVVLRCMQHHHVRRIVFSSSATVYGANNKSPLLETMMQLEPSNPYGRSKLFIEHIIRDACSAHTEKSSSSSSSWQCVILRYFNPVGAHPSGMIGESPRGTPNNLMPYVLQVAAGRIPRLTVHGSDYETQDGTCERDFIHVTDLAKGHVAALDMSQLGTHVINLGSGKATSVMQMVKCVEKASGRKIPLDMGPRRPGDLPVVFADPGKAWELLKWKTTLSLEDMCRDGWNWQIKNLKGYEN